MENSSDDMNGARIPGATPVGRIGPPFRFKFWFGVTIAWLPFVVVSILAFLTAKNFDEQLGGGLFAVVTIVSLIICLRMVREASRYRLDYDDVGIRTRDY